MEITKNISLICVLAVLAVGFTTHADPSINNTSGAEHIRKEANVASLDTTPEAIPAPISNTTTPAPSNATTTTPAPSNTTTTTPAPSNATTTTPTPSNATTTTPAPVTPTTPIPNSTTTVKPSSSSTSSPTTINPPTPSPKPCPKPDRSFDLSSFLGGIILSVGLMAIGYVVFKFYKARTDPTYRSL